MRAMLASALAPRGWPPSTLTRGLAQEGKGRERQGGQRRAATPSSSTAVFLASADADYIVAQTLNVDGGNWMS